ncbi:Uncharacterised protein [Mycobacteroides abscessus subsp. abscessus]|nr:Uncharacterised protein [Mycobacteroides abscessus subsp. abscessus]
MIARGCSRIAVMSGERLRTTSVFSAFCRRLNVSVSTIIRRSGTMSAARTAPRTKSTLHPHDSIASVESVLASRAPEPTASRAPTSLFAAAQLAASPRLPGFADSMRKTMIPVYSAPTENPERQRKKTRPTPAQIPIVL